MQSRRFGTLQLILNPRPDTGPGFQLARKLVALVDRVAGEILNRTDAHVGMCQFLHHRTCSPGA